LESGWRGFLSLRDPAGARARGRATPPKNLVSYRLRLLARAAVGRRAFGRSGHWFVFGFVEQAAAAVQGGRAETLADEVGRLIQ
jgi:hypothetical protein